MQHEFLTESHFRWCIGCTLFQREREEGWPDALDDCPRTTIHAQIADRDKKALALEELRKALRPSNAKTGE